MISKENYEDAKDKTLAYLKNAGIVLRPDEMEQIEVADMGLNDLDNIGLEIITYVNTSRVCAKELVLFPRQTCPEHYHPPIVGEEGKEETFRCRWGKVFLYVPGSPTTNPQARVPANRASHFTVWHEIELNPGDQYTLPPNTLHWFQAGDKGAVISEFSTRSRDESDIFTDPDIQREPLVDTN